MQLLTTWCSRLDDLAMIINTVDFSLSKSFPASVFDILNLLEQSARYGNSLRILELFKGHPVLNDPSAHLKLQKILDSKRYHRLEELMNKESKTFLQALAITIREHVTVDLTLDVTPMIINEENLII